MNGEQPRPGATGVTRAHSLAFASRTTGLRNRYLCQQLADERAHNEQLYNMCEEYVNKYGGEYRQFKRTMDTERLLGTEWGSLPWRQRVFVILHHPVITPAGIAVAVLSSLIAILSAITLIIETLPEYNPIIHPENELSFILVELFVTVYFTAETVLAVATAGEKLKYVKTVQFWIDVISASPFYLILAFGTFVPGAAAALETLRMTRLFRLGKYVRTFYPVVTLWVALRQTIKVLTGPLFFLTCCALVAASALYYLQAGTLNRETGKFEVENCNCDASPRGLNGTICQPTTSQISHGIPTTTWWSVVTIMTVGFGDIVPQCAVGRVIAAACMIISTIVLAMPIAVLGDTFTSEARRGADVLNDERSALATWTATEHHRVVQMAVAHRLHEIRPEKLAALCSRAGLPTGQPREMCRALYELLGVSEHAPADDADVAPDAHEVPAVLTLAESLVEYLRMRTPYEIIDLAQPAPAVMRLIDTYFERVYLWWAGKPSRELARRLVSSDTQATQRIVPLTQNAEFSIGIAVPDVSPPDIVLPKPPNTRVAFAPRMATLTVARQFGRVQYTLCPVDAFRPLVNGEAITRPVLLEHRDLVNFGTEAVPLLYTFERLDEYAHATASAKPIDDGIQSRLWLAHHSPAEVLGAGLAPRPSAASLRSLGTGVSPRDVQFQL